MAQSEKELGSSFEGPPPGALERLTDMLEWSPDAHASDDVRNRYRTLLEERRDELVARALTRSVAGAREAADVIAMLDERAADRVMGAPETSHRLLSDDAEESTIQFLRTTCDAERAMEGDLRGVSALWTALGDRYFPAATAHDVPTGRIEADFDPRVPYTAPRLRSIVVDHMSPRAREAHGPSGVVDDTPSAEEAREAHRKLLLAAELISRVDPVIGRFVDREIITIVLRAERASEAIGSSSTPEYIGRAVVWNAHLPGADIADLAEQLVHEAIHCHAYRVELLGPWLAGAMTRDPMSVISPWTGRPLSVHTYLHACFVWYGLAHFWFATFDRGVLPDRQTLAYLVRALQGFAVHSLSDLVGEAKPRVADIVLSTVDRMQLSLRLRWHECIARTSEKSSH